MRLSALNNALRVGRVYKRDLWTSVPNCARRQFASDSNDSLPNTDTENDNDYDFGSYDVILPDEPYVWGVSHIKPRTAPSHIRKPGYVQEAASLSPRKSPAWNIWPREHKRIALGGEDEVRLRNAAKLAREVLTFAGSLVKVGVTTDVIDAQVHDMIVSHSAYPSPLLYKGFPKACCTSINNIVTHGIPDNRPLQDGDIVNIDITVYKDGFHGDTSRTFLVGNVDEKGRELVSITEQALEAGIAVCGPGRPFKDIGRAIFEQIRHKDFCVSTQFTGHGIGEDFHRPPWILHHPNSEPGAMRPGHCFTIEPAIIQGSEPNAWIFPDGWTASTENCARAAQAEHMVLITDSGADVLTR